MTHPVRVGGWVRASHDNSVVVRPIRRGPPQGLAAGLHYPQLSAHKLQRHPGGLHAAVQYVKPAVLLLNACCDEKGVSTEREAELVSHPVVQVEELVL